MTQSIHSLIHGTLRRNLVVCVVVSALLAVVCAAVSVRHSEQQAERFVMAHVARLARSGVFSQTIGNIDSETAKFAQTWDETQDLGLRVNIFLNGRQISHAGQLQPFQSLSASRIRKLALPSGDELRVEIQVDLKDYIIFSLILLISFELAIFGIFFILNRSMQRSIRHLVTPIEYVADTMNTVAKDLPDSARLASSIPVKLVGIREIDDLSRSFHCLSKQITCLEDHLAHVNFDRGRLKMAEQVSHSIKGIIAILQLKAGRFASIDDTDNQSLTDCITTLRNLTENLLRSKKVFDSSPRLGAGPGQARPSAQLLPALRAAVSMKRQQYATHPGIKIALHGQIAALGRWVPLASSDLQSILFNLIDNAIEASCPERSKVEIAVQLGGDEYVELSIRDEGRGVPAEILPRLMTEGFTFGKDGGNGFGLFHARELALSAGGRIDIESKEQVGTTVQITLPLATPQFDHVRAIVIRKGLQIVCIDDDPLIHSTWKLRFSGSGEMPELIHLFSADEVRAWIATHGVGDFGQRLYLFDFDLGRNSATGLDLIAEYGLALESILVSGMVEDPAVQLRAMKMGLKCLSKEYLDLVPIEFESGEFQSRQDEILRTSHLAI